MTREELIAALAYAFMMSDDDAPVVESRHRKMAYKALVTMEYYDIPITGMLDGSVVAVPVEPDDDAMGRLGNVFHRRCTRDLPLCSDVGFFNDVWEAVTATPIEAPDEPTTR